jgi:exoribonuclease-2
VRDPLDDARDLREQGLLDPLPPEVETSLPDAPRLPSRGLPLLELPFVSIDTAEPHEVDDALYAETFGDGWRLWIAIASPACWVDKDGPADLAALDRGATLYHPRHVVGMLPDLLARDRASLGVGQARPSLVFRVDLDGKGELVGSGVQEATIRVAAAWSYAQLDLLLGGSEVVGIDGPLARLLQAACRASETARIAKGAYLLYKPDVEIKAPPGQPVTVRDASQSQPARRLVTEAMVLCGLCAARFCTVQRVPVPFRVQPPPHKPSLPPAAYTDPAQCYAVFRSLQPARTSIHPGPHGVIAAPAYVQASSPLRRYTDLLVHRQILACLRGEPLPHADLTERIARAELAQQSRRNAQRKGERHWKLVWLAEQGPGLRLAAQIVRNLPQRSEKLAFVPTLALEVPVRADACQPGDAVDLVVTEINPVRGHVSARLAPA